MKDILGPIVEPLQKFAECDTEQKDLDARAGHAQRELDSAAAAGPLTDPQISRRISAANETLNAVNLRKGHLAKTVDQRFVALQSALNQSVRDWTLSIELSAKIIETRFIKHNLKKFFNGDEEAARSALTGIALPGTDWRNRLWFEADSRMTKETIVRLAKRFAQHVAHFLPELVEIPDDIFS